MANILPDKDYKPILLIILRVSKYNLDIIYIKNTLFIFIKKIIINIKMDHRDITFNDLTHDQQLYVLRLVALHRIEDPDEFITLVETVYDQGLNHNNMYSPRRVARRTSRRTARRITGWNSYSPEKYMYSPARRIARRNILF